MRIEKNTARRAKTSGVKLKPACQGKVGAMRYSPRVRLQFRHRAKARALSYSPCVELKPACKARARASCKKQLLPCRHGAGLRVAAAATRLRRTRALYARPYYICGTGCLLTHGAVERWTAGSSKPMGIRRHVSRPGNSCQNVQQYGRPSSRFGDSGARKLATVDKGVRQLKRATTDSTS